MSKKLGHCVKQDDMERVIEKIATAADGKGAIERTIDGLRDCIECLPGARERGVIYGSGAWQLGDIQKNPALQEAYQMGKSVC